MWITGLRRKSSPGRRAKTLEINAEGCRADIDGRWEGSLCSAGNYCSIHLDNQFQGYALGEIGGRHRGGEAHQ